MERTHAANADPELPRTPGEPALAHEAAPFAELVQRLTPALYAWASVRIPPFLRARLAPDDLTQEVHCRALERAHAFDPGRGTLRAWLFGIATHVLNEELRRLHQGPGPTGHRTSASGDTGLAAVPAEVTSVASRLARDERLALLVQRLGELPEDDRRLLIYRGLEGLSAADAGVLLGLGEEATAKRWQRLRERLRSGWLPPDLFAE